MPAPSQLRPSGLNGQEITRPRGVPAAALQARAHAALVGLGVAVAAVVFVQPEHHVGRREVGQVRVGGGGLGQHLAHQLGAGGAGALVVGAVVRHPGRVVVGRQPARKSSRYSNSMRKPGKWPERHSQNAAQRLQQRCAFQKQYARLFVAEHRHGVAHAQAALAGPGHVLAEQRAAFGCGR